MAAKNDTQAEAEKSQATSGDGKQAPRKRLFSRKRMIMTVAGLVVLCVAGGGGYFYLFDGHGSGAAALRPKPVVFFDLPDVLVNLSSSGGERTQYLKVKVTLELSDASISEQIRPIMPRLLDTFQTYLRELRPRDLNGSAGLYRLKEELTRRVNVAIAPSRINAVLFKEIVVQ
jgi:flagellar protein FliL